MTAPQAIIRALPIKSIDATSNVRISNGYDKPGLMELAESIKTHGLIQPIVVRAYDGDTPEAFEWSVIAGRRRIAACKLAGLVEIPAIVSDADATAAYLLEAAENIQRENMTLADTARFVRLMMTVYDNAQTVGKIVNKSKAWVSKHLTITASTFPTPIAELLDRGIVQDLECLLLLKQIADTPATNPRAASTLTRMLRIAHAGDMNRQIARDALANLRAPATPTSTPVVTTTTHVKANHETTQSVEGGEPKTHFTVEVPIGYLETFETAGGVKWLIEQLRFWGPNSTAITP